MRTQDYRSGFIGLLLLVGTVLLFAGGPDYYSSRSVRHAWDTGHILYFALLTLLLCRWRPIAGMPLTRQWITILAITLLVGVAIELMQYGTARAPSAADISGDLTGSLLVLVFGPPGSRLRPAYRRRAFQLAVAAAVLVQLWPLTRALIDEATAWYQFPLLSGFETPFEIDRWDGGNRLSVEPLSPSSPGHFLKLSLTTDRYSGVTLRYFDGDWSAARTLQIRFYNPETHPLQITCRIHDQQHSDGNEAYNDRYNRAYVLKPGWSRIVIDLDEVKNSPTDRSMDMRRIRGLICFAESLPAAHDLYLDDVLLSY